MRSTLKTVILQKVNEPALTGDQLAALQKLQADYATPGRKIDMRVLAGIAALVLVTVFSLKSFISPGKDMVQLIASEVVTNHLHLKPLDVSTNSMKGIQQYFTRLTFKPVASATLPGLSNKLLGGRYCSLQGITAAQLRLKNQKNGELDTLYQTEYRKDIFGKLPDINKGEKPVYAWAKGIKVKIWVENDVLFAMTLVE